MERSVKIEQIVEFLTDQSDEPGCGHLDDRIHYWRDKALTASKSLRELSGAAPSTWRQGLDDLSSDLLAILANIQTAAHMAEVLATDEDEAAAWKMIREKAAEGPVAYRAVRFPPSQSREAD